MRCTRLAIALLAPCWLVGPALASNPPADICVELAGWLNQRAAQAAAAPQQPGGAQAGQQALAPQGAEKAQPPAAGQQQAGAGQDAAPRRDLNTAVERARPADPQRPSGQDEPQMTSGLSGPVTGAGPGAAGPQGSAQEASQSGAPNPRADPGPPQELGSGPPRPEAAKPGEQRAPEPAAQAKPPEPKPAEPDPRALEQARKSAQAQDQQACRTVVREMRVAGVALPGPLIALAALRADYAPAGQGAGRGGAPGAGQGAADAPAQPEAAPGLPPIPRSGIAPGQPGLQTR